MGGAARPKRAQRVNRRHAFLEALECRRLLTTYYVSPAGNDANAGTSAAAPLQRLQVGVSRLHAGDTLNIMAGNYAEGFVLGWDATGLYGALNGSAGAPILIQADPAAPAGSVVISGRNNKSGDGIDMEPGNSWVILRNLTVTNGSGTITRDGIHVSSSDNVRVVGCTVSRAARFGIFCSFTTNFLVQGNVVVNTVGNGDATTGHGIYISNSDVNPTIRGNLIANNAMQGLHLNGDLSQGGNGMIQGALIEGNIIRNNGANGINGDGVTNSRIQNNLIYGNGKHGIVLYQIDAAAGSTGDVIVNNTIVQPNSSGAAIELVSGSANETVFNNILIGGRQGSFNISNDSLPRLKSDYNAVVDLFENDDTGQTSTLAQWRRLTGSDAHSFTISLPQTFSNVSTNDYFPRAGAAVVNAGVTAFNGAQAPTFDINGSVRGGGAPDVGTYEFGAGARPNTPPTGFVDKVDYKSLSGWTADMDAPGVSLTVRLDVDGQTFANGSASRARADLTQLVGSANHGFVFDLSGLTPGIHRLDVFAIDANTGQATLLASREVSTNAPPAGWIDVANATTLAGWAADANAGAAAIQVRYVIDGNAAAVVTANRVRNDLQNVVGSTGHGFMVTLPQLTAGMHTVSVYAIDNTSLEGVLIGTRVIAVANPAGNVLPTGFVESASATRVSGWAMDASSAGASIQVRVDVDGVVGTAFAANGVRADVVKALGVVGNFGFSKVLALTPGEHRVTVYALDTTTGGATMLGSRVVTAVGNLGSIDVITPTRIAGWAFSGALAGAAATVRIDIDGLAGTPVVANFARTDLVNLLGAATFGFNATLPGMTAGQHTVSLWVLDPLTLTLAKLATTSVTTAP